MSKLNAVREVPYEFRVVAIDGWVWLYDNSERTYICDAVPKIFAEPLYALTKEEFDYPEADYFGASTIEPLDTIAVERIHPEDIAPTTPHKEAWDSAREEACGNCLL